MPSCWSCLVVIESGALVCPLCGADQTRPVEFINPNVPQPQNLKAVAQHWAIVIVVIVVFVGGMAALLWYYFGGLRTTPDSQAADVAAKSLRSVREELSAYSLVSRDSYPKTLDPLGDLARRPAEVAMGVGYKLFYTPQQPVDDGVVRGFVLQARPEKNGFPNLYIDESGLVRATQENRTATAGDPLFDR